MHMETFSNLCQIMSAFTGFKGEFVGDRTTQNKTFGEVMIRVLFRHGHVPGAFTYAGIVIAMGFGDRVENTAI